MQVYVNGESKQLADNSSLAELIAQLGLPAARIAIELNRIVIRRANWEKTFVREGDRVEIVHFVGGGNENPPTGNVSRSPTAKAAAQGPQAWRFRLTGSEGVESVAQLLKRSA